MISNNLTHKSLDTNIPEHTLQEKKIGKKIAKVAAIIQNKLSELDHNIKKRCFERNNKKLKKRDVWVQGNSICNFKKWLENFFSEIKKDFGKDLEQEIKIENNEHLVNLKTLKQLRQAFMENILEVLSKEFDVKVLSHSFKIEESDIKNYRMSKDQRKNNEKVFDCFCYTLYKAQEPEFENWLFKENHLPIPKAKLWTELFKNRFIVKEPQKDDIIIYHKENRPIHFGMFSDFRTVHSKWGKLPQIFSHPIYTQPYGNSFVILRKKSN